MNMQLLNDDNIIYYYCVFGFPALDMICTGSWDNSTSVFHGVCSELFYRDMSVIFVTVAGSLGVKTASVSSCVISFRSPVAAFFVRRWQYPKSFSRFRIHSSCCIEGDLNSF